MRLRQITFLIMMLLFAAPVLAASGVRGRVAYRGDVVHGLKVRAYRSISDIPAEKPVSVSAPSALDGTYTLELPPGSYYLTARSYETTPSPGDYFCYYSGAPVRVDDGAFVNVGFNLIRIPKEALPVSGPASGIQGEITFQDKPLERVYLYVYKDPGELFKGPGYQIHPVAKGTFSLRLPPGDYWLLARKRAKGGQFGPVETGDYFSYYYGNPVRIESGKIRNARLEAVARLSIFDEGEAPSSNGIQGRVLGPGGKPAPGLYVFGYRNQAMTGAPEVFSTRTGQDGSFRLSLPEPGAWYFLARENFGGPASEGELYGRFGGDKAEPVLFDSKKVRKVTIHVQRKENP